MSQPFPNKLPNERVTITDDVKAKAFLLAEGLFDKLTSEPALGHTAMCCHYGHSTHWVLGCRFHGNKNPKDNGFAVFAWPKNKWPRTVLEEAVKQQKLGVPEWQSDGKDGGFRN